MMKIYEIYLFLLFVNCNYCFILNLNLQGFKQSNEITKINNIYSINRIINYNDNNEVLNIFSVYKNEINGNKEIIYTQKKYPKKYDENNKEIIEFELLFYNSLKYIKDLYKFIDWLYDDYFSDIKKDDGKKYNLFSACIVEKEEYLNFEDYKDYKNKNTLFENYLINDYKFGDIEFIDKYYKSPFNYDIFNDD
jgi:hypothetical protein